jgi:hypothetical protein
MGFFFSDSFDRPTHCPQGAVLYMEYNYLHCDRLTCGIRELSRLLFRMSAVPNCCRWRTEVRWDPSAGNPSPARSSACRFGGASGNGCTALRYFTSAPLSPEFLNLRVRHQCVRTEWRVHQDSRSALSFVLRHVKHRGYFRWHQIPICARMMWCWECTWKYLWEEHSKRYISPD